MPAMLGADCHLHVFDPQLYPYQPGSAYLPHACQEGTPEQFLSLLDAHGLSHGLVVSAGPYGTDTRCLLDAIGRSNNRLKGIALVENSVSEKEIARLTAGGVVGVRVNLHNLGTSLLADPSVARLLGTLKEANWFCQIQCSGTQLIDAMPLLQKSGVRVMIDHCGRPEPDKGVQERGFQALLELGRGGNAVIKLSGPFRYSKQSWGYFDIDAFVAALIDAFTLNNCVWGSDWPFVRHDARIDYAPMLACIKRWLPDANDYRKVLCENPKRLFGFC